MVWTPGDAAQTVKGILSDGWTAGNTGSRTPDFNMRETKKRLGVDDNDQVLAYNVNSAIEIQGLPRGHVQSDDYCTVDIMTAFSRAQMLLIIKEVQRLLKASNTQPTSSPSGAQYDEIFPVAVVWLQDYFNFWRVNVEVRCIEYFTAR